LVRTDGEFNTGRVLIDSNGDALELRLKADSTNVFEIRCYDSKGISWSVNRKKSLSYRE
jgi:hypothetical protein